MSDDLMLIILLGIISTIFFFNYFIAKVIGRVIFNRLISDTAKNRLMDYYRFRFFPTLIKGAFAGLCVGPLYSAPNYIYYVINSIINHDDLLSVIDSIINCSVINSFINSYPCIGLGLQILLWILAILLWILFFPCYLTFVSILCALFGMVFKVLSDLLLSIIKKIVRSDIDSGKKGQIISAEQSSAIIVWTLFGAMFISRLFLDTNILVCLILSGVLVLGKTILKSIVGYFVCKGTRRVWQKFQKYSSVMVFLISVLCVLFSCMYCKSIDFAKFGDRMLNYGPLLLFFSFYDELSKFSFVRKVGLFMAEGIIVDLNVNVESPSSRAPIYIFSSAVSFVLTFVLTNEIILSLVSVVIAILSLKKVKFEWIYAAFGVVVSFILLSDSNPNYDSSYNSILLVLAVSVLYAMSFLVIKFLKSIAREDINMKIPDELLDCKKSCSSDSSSEVEH